MCVSAEKIGGFYKCVGSNCFLGRKGSSHNPLPPPLSFALLSSIFFFYCCFLMALTIKNSIISPYTLLVIKRHYDPAMELWLGGDVRASGFRKRERAEWREILHWGRVRQKEREREREREKEQHKSTFYHSSVIQHQLYTILQYNITNDTTTH